MTKNQALRRHRMLWRWLARNPSKEKSQWPGWKKNGGKYKPATHDCFLCEMSSCTNCPVIWPNATRCGDSLFADWEEARGAKRALLAKKISELPRRR